MAIKDDTSAWRSRVDKKLTDLSSRQRKLEQRMDAYEIKQQDHYKLTELIKESIDVIKKRTEPAVEAAERLGRIQRGMKGFGRLWRGFTEAVNRNGLFLLVFLTLAWVLEHSHTVTQAWEMFIQTFNGTTRG